MSGDLISRSALLEEYEWLKSQVNPGSVAEVEEHIARIRRIPAVEAEPVVHAHRVAETARTYMPVEFDENGELVIHSIVCYKCSRCGTGVPKDAYYCRICGAHMDEEVTDV